MLQSKDIENFFFLGIGGIGMSALARYFQHNGYAIYGYDRTPSPLTRELEEEGMTIVYGDDHLAISDCPSLEEDGKLVISQEKTLVVRTPAVPSSNAIYTYLQDQGYDIRKRAEVLGLVTRQKKALCVAGTHGKTTTSTTLAHLMANGQMNGRMANGEGGDGVNAFLGGISMNYNTNVLIDSQSEYVVVEADEYDRSFHHLTPYISVVTAVDPDHLDIYGSPEAYREAFAHYTSLITDALVMKHGIALEPRLQPGVKCYTYGVLDKNEGTADLPDFYAENIRVSEGQIEFDFHTPSEVVSDIRLGVPVWVNIENTVAAMAVAWIIKEEEQDELPGEWEKVMKSQAASFKGVWRRFNIHVNTPKVVYIDDYAHHPQEIATSIDSIRKLYPTRKLIGVFQPHLYTRTRDFAEGFKQVLRTLDECILLPIYPARELPIPGVTSEMLGGRVVEKKDLVGVLEEKVQKAQEPLVILTVGAGDIDRLVPDVSRALKNC
ncbi:MAG: UDP-N-acetylmuramate--L-alanine ligase [Paludibacteraceae bacterium]|nr:UDP-N-acetylmuramate--L-alanine ligase [Paludibacteraceae bacterium]